MTREQEMAVLRQAVDINRAAGDIARQRAEEYQVAMRRAQAENIQLKLRVAELERDIRVGISAD